MSLMEIQSLIKTYGKGELSQTVLHGVNLSIPEGKMIALVGPSGSGKSTLLSILGSLLRPTSGTIRMLGAELTSFEEAELTFFRNQYIGFVYQFHHLLPDFTAQENVYFPAAGRKGAVTREMREYASYLLTRVGLENRIHYASTKLSGGQKQRVAIARALMNKPKLILADEPTGNLDRTSADQVMQLLADIQREQNTTFIISTHDEHIAAFCNSTIRMLDGRIESFTEQGATG
jgi:lipoprotein-releasing system ATP-binding protein